MNVPTPSNRFSSRASAAAALALWLVFSSAVPRADAAEPATSKASDDGPITLSPFTVDDSRDVGYLASNTLAGSRLNTSLRDTPAAISVMTPEFLADIAAFDLKEAVGYAVNVETELSDSDAMGSDAGNLLAADHQVYRVRGLRASTARNYFTSHDLPTETALVERIEDSRGPNSVLFGIASPGGLLNSNTKQALTGRRFRRASFTVASFGSWRGTFDYNQPLLNGKAAIRLNTVYNNHQSHRHWQYEEQKRAHVAASYRLTGHTRIRAEFEHGQIDDNQPRTQTLDDQFLRWDSLGRPIFATIPDAATRTANGLTQISTTATAPRVTYIANNNTVLSMRGALQTLGTNRVITDTRIADYSVNVGGPGQGRESRFNVYSAFLEHQFSKTSFLELAFNHMDLNFDRIYALRGGSNQLKGDPQQFLPTGAPNPFAGRLMIEANWFRSLRLTSADSGRATFSQEFDAGKWGNYRFAALGEYRKVFRGTTETSPIWVDAQTGQPAFNTAAPESSTNYVWYRTYVTERDWASYHQPHYNQLAGNVTDPVTGRTLAVRWISDHANTPEEFYSSERTMMLMTQARYFKGRLILAGGFRRDDVGQYLVARKRDPQTREWIIARNPAEAEAVAQGAQWSNAVGRNKTMGLSFHATSKLSLYYNRADNIGPPGWGRRVLPPDGKPGNIISPPSTKGEGQDIGFALNLLDGRIHARTSYYTTKSKSDGVTRPAVPQGANNRIVNALQEAGIISQEERDIRIDLGNLALFDHESKGIELQVTTNVTRKWRLQANFARTEANETNRALEWLAWEKQNKAWLDELNTKNAGRNLYGIVTSGDRTIAEELVFLMETNNGLIDFTETAGKGKRGNRRHKVNFFTRYNFTSDLLKGAYIGGGYRHQSKMFIGLDPNLEKIYGNSYWLADAMAGYQMRPLRNGIRVGFQLNVMNLFDNDEPMVTRSTADRVSIVRYALHAPRAWRLTANFEF